MKNNFKGTLIGDLIYIIPNIFLILIIYYYNKILSGAFLLILFIIVIYRLINKKHENNEQNIKEAQTDKDISKAENKLEKIEENKQSIMLIEVDNRDEVIRTMEDDKKPLLFAQIERTIQGYASSMNAMVKKYSSTKYILLVQDKYIKEEIEKKFTILKLIKEINEGNTIAVTLSIGIGMQAATPAKGYDMAASARDLAIGRGGAQVVVKDGKNILFFGGTTKEIERSTRVRARVISQALLGLINESSTIFIMGHNNPDVDCLGAAAGLYRVIKTLNKKCYIIYENANNKTDYLIEKFEKDEEYSGLFIDSKMTRNIYDEKSLLIIVDSGSKNHVINKDLLKYIKRQVVIDHHRKSQDYIDNTLLAYVEPYASSASEMVTEILQYALERPKLRGIEAEALLAGIIVDTKSFYFKTGVRTFEAAAFLKRWGADTIDIKKMFSNDLDSYLVKASIIKSAVVENGIAIAVCPDEIEDTIIAAQAADELLNITGITVSFVIDKIKNDIMISGRSLGDINVQIILETLGGGGHMTMAGAKLKDTSIDKAKQLLKDAIDKYIMEGEK